MPALAVKVVSASAVSTQPTARTEPPARRTSRVRSTASARKATMAQRVPFVRTHAFQTHAVPMPCALHHSQIQPTLFAIACQATLAHTVRPRSITAALIHARMAHVSTGILALIASALTASKAISANKRLTNVDQLHVRTAVHACSHIPTCMSVYVPSTTREPSVRPS